MMSEEQDCSGDEARSAPYGSDYVYKYYNDPGKEYHERQLRYGLRGHRSFDFHLKDDASTSIPSDAEALFSSTPETGVGLAKTAALQLNVMIYLNLVLACWRLQHYAQARIWLGEALRLVPETDNSQLWARCVFWQGQLHAASGEIQEARDAFLAAKDLIDCETKEYDYLVKYLADQTEDTVARAAADEDKISLKSDDFTSCEETFMFTGAATPITTTLYASMLQANSINPETLAHTQPWAFASHDTLDIEHLNDNCKKSNADDILGKTIRRTDNLLVDGVERSHKHESQDTSGSQQVDTIHEPQQSSLPASLSFPGKFRQGSLFAQLMADITDMQSPQSSPTATMKSLNRSAGQTQSMEESPLSTSTSITPPGQVDEVVQKYRDDPVLSRAKHDGGWHPSVLSIKKWAQDPTNVRYSRPVWRSQAVPEQAKLSDTLASSMLEDMIQDTANKGQFLPALGYENEGRRLSPSEIRRPRLHVDSTRLSGGPESPASPVHPSPLRQCSRPGMGEDDESL